MPKLDADFQELIAILRQARDAVRDELELRRAQDPGRGLPPLGGPGPVLVHDGLDRYGWGGWRSGSGWRSRPLDDLWSWGPIAQR